MKKFLLSYLKQDERYAKNSAAACIWCVLFTFLYCAGVSLYKVCTTKKFISCAPEAALIPLLIVVLIAANMIWRKEFRIKKTDLKLFRIDERTATCIGTVCSFGTLFTITYCIAVSTFMICRTKVVTRCLPEIALILLLSIVMVIANKSRNEMFLPRSLSRRILPTGSKLKDKLIRYRQYLIEALTLGASMAIISAGFNYLGGVKDDRFDGVSVLIGMSSIFISIFVVSLLLDFLVGELSVIHYRHICRKLEQDED